MLYGRGQQSWLQVPNALHHRQTFCTQLAVIVSGYIAITSCLSHSFFFTFLPPFPLVGGGALGMLVSYTEMRTIKTIFLSSNGVFDNFCAFWKVESPIFGFLDKKPSRKCNTCAYKNLNGFVLERFFKSLYRPIQIVQVAKG